MGAPQFAIGPGGLRVAYDDEPPSADPDGVLPVVLVHGLGSHRRRWDLLAEHLREAGHRVVRHDLRGFGDSDPSPGPYAVADLAADLAAVMGAAGLERFHLVGHSLGGMIAQRFALDHGPRLRTLALVSTTSHNGRRASVFGRVMAEVSERGFDAAAGDPDVKGRLEALLAEAFPGTPPPLNLFRRGLERPHPAQALAWNATVGFSVKDHLAQLRMPVLVLHGTADRVIPPVMGDLIHQAIPGSTVHRMDAIGHHPHRESPAAFTQLLLAHLADSNR
jgi:3-oxoadipate enol-lactonase